MRQAARPEGERRFGRGQLAAGGPPAGSGPVSKTKVTKSASALVETSTETTRSVGSGPVSAVTAHAAAVGRRCSAVGRGRGLGGGASALGRRGRRRRRARRGAVPTADGGRRRTPLGLAARACRGPHAAGDDGKAWQGGCRGWSGGSGESSQARDPDRRSDRTRRPACRRGRRRVVRAARRATLAVTRTHSGSLRERGAPGGARNGESVSTRTRSSGTSARDLGRGLLAGDGRRARRS